MTARTWCSLWKPSIHRGTELLKYQTQRWIPLQTCSLFFTVGPDWCKDRLVAEGSPSVCVALTPSCTVFSTDSDFFSLFWYFAALVVRYHFSEIGTFVVCFKS